VKKDLEDVLFKKYPNIFKQKDNDKMSISRGIQCKDGWYDLIDILCAKITQHIEFKNKKLDEQFKARPKTLIPSSYSVKLIFEASQVKSKFDGLRFYFDGGDDYTFGIVAMAEAMSLRICEYCGNKKFTTEEVETKCEKCRKN